MKRKFLMVLTLVLWTSAGVIFGQDTIDTIPVPEIGINPDTYTGLDAFTNSINWLYGILIIAGGYLSHLIPGLKKVGSGVYRVLSVAIVMGLGFFVFDAGSTLTSLIITYTVSTSFYEVILKLFKKSPAPEVTTV